MIDSPIDIGDGKNHIPSHMMRYLCFLIALGTAVPALAQRNPYDTEVSRLASQAERAGRSPLAILPILELRGLTHFASPGVARSRLTRLARSRRLSPAMRAFASTQEAFEMLSAGDARAARERLAELGYLSDFRIIGGFDDEGQQGFERVYPPEEQQNTPISGNPSYAGKERQVQWRDYPSDLGRYGFVDFDATLRPYENACAYAETFVTLDRARPMSIWMGSGGSHKVWVNGQNVLSDDVYRLPTVDRSAAVFQGREGANRILVKVCVQSRRWGFYLRLGEVDGGPPQDVIYGRRGITEAATAPSNAGTLPNPPLPAPPIAPLAALEAAVVADEDDAVAHYDLARLLAWTGAQENTDVRSRDLSERASELQPSVDHLLFASSQAETRAKRMNFVAQAEESFGRDPRVRLARIELTATGPDSGRALRMLEQFPMRSMVGFEAAWIRATMLEQRNLPDAAMALIEDALRRTRGSLHWRFRFGHALDRAGRVEAARTEHLAVLEIDPGNVDLRFTFMRDAFTRGEHDQLFHHLDILRAADPASPRILHYAASVYEGLGRHDEALNIYRQIIAYAPDEPRHHAGLAAAYLRLGQQSAAIDEYRQVLALAPQDAGARQILDRLQPRERPDERWATPTEEILARRTDDTRWPITMLHELQVTTVLDSGLAANFHQVAFQVHDDEGARRMSGYPIGYEPGRQWVDIRSAKVHRADGTVVDVNNTYEQSVGDSRYRIYYDTRVRVIDLPQLRPGDTVELRYRVEDVSRRNMFNDYYGSVRYFQGSSPSAHWEHVLVTPQAREFYFNQPQLPDLAHTRQQDGEQNIDRFVATNLTPIQSEPNMPGAAETRAYLHVSTYRTWEDVGHWWWGLVQDQLVPDESLIQTTRDLVAGAPNDREIVQRVYDWVIRNTRYVGLEFGIHGFKPYRVTQIVGRGFGDCKDKASLIYAMLTIAGVDARIALIRTRRNGQIDTSPASLSVFDHAIAYVPQFDLFLDGTAETNGSGELPAGDQGTMTLVVGPETAELRITPELAPNRSVRTRQLTVTLGRDGSGVVQGQESVSGSSASYYRSHYQAEGLRTERLQRELSGPFPGIEVTTQRFEHLDEYEQTPTYTWAGTVPQFAERTGNQLLMAPSSLGGLVRNYAQTPRRRHSLELGAPRQFQETRTLRLSQGLSVVTLPSGGEVESPFGRLSIHYTRRGNTITIRTEYEIRVSRVTTQEYPQFRDFAQRADVLLRERLTLGGAQ